MRNTKNKCKGRFFGFRRNFSKSNKADEKIKGINISFEDKYSSDTVVSSSGEQNLSTSLSISSESSVTCPGKNTVQGQGSVSGESKSSKERTLKPGGTTIACDVSASKSNSFSNSRSSLSHSLQDSSLTSLLSESSSNSSSKYDKKTSKFSRCSHTSTYRHQSRTNSIIPVNYEYIGTPSEEKHEQNFITKNKEGEPTIRPKNRFESCTRTDDITMSNSRNGTFCLNKSMLDILNNKDPIKREKRTTQRVVAIENLDTHVKDTQRSIVSNETDNLCHKEKLRNAFEESSIVFDDKGLLSLVPIIGPICCHINNYSDYDILIDCVCINEDQYDLYSFTDILY